MLKGTRTLYVACSGGPDSTALLYLFVLFRKSLNISLGIIHVNHGLRGKASDLDETKVQSLAKKLRLPFISGRVDVKGLARKKRYSIEEAAREARYGFFVKAAKPRKIDAIALGHTMDDQAETVLMRMLTGSGLTGLGGSRPVFERGDIRFIRPLIETSKDDVLRFLKERNIRFSIDETNRSDRFLRNRIRLKLMPYLETHFQPGTRRVLARLPEALRSDADFLESEANRQFFRLHKMRGGKIIFPRKPFQRLPEAMQFRLLRTAVQTLASIEFSQSHWLNFRELMANRKKFYVFFPGKVLCVTDANEMVLKKSGTRVLSTKQTRYAYKLDLGRACAIPESGSSICCRELAGRPSRLKKEREDFAVLDRERIKFPLVVRNRRSGDLFQPLGQDRPMKLKNFLINRKIPKEKRGFLPLVLSGGKIVWIAGVAVSDSVKVTEGTRKFLRISTRPIQA